MTLLFAQFEFFRKLTSIDTDIGWIEQPDGTFVRKTSSWASWSKTGHSGDDFDQEYLNQVQKDLESKAKANLRNGGNNRYSR